MLRFRRMMMVLLVGFGALLLAGCFGPGLGGAGQQTQQIKAGPVPSPDGSRIAFLATHDGDPEIYVMNADGSNLKKLTDNDSMDLDPTWGPEGNTIYFSSNRAGSYEIYRMNADGSGQEMIATIVDGEQQ